MDTSFVQNIRSDWQITSAYFAVLASAMALDILLGMLIAFKGQKLDSSVGRVGVIRKVAVMLMVLMVSVFDGVVPAFPINISGQHFVMPVASIACIWFIVGVEWVSLSEKAKVLGIPMPKRLSDALTRVREQLSDENEQKKDIS
jgi:toxin secretion/phage lysis holin